MQGILLFRGKKIVKPDTIFTNYLAKHGIQTGERVKIPDFRPELIVVIPCFNEDAIVKTLTSVFASYNFSPVSVLVIVVVNAAENSPPQVIQQNLQTIKDIETCKQGIRVGEHFQIEIIREDELPVKDAGVGLARKIGMDEAVRIFLHHQKNGIIACLDADSLCSCDYLIRLVEEFRESKSWDAASIHFEHPLEGYPDKIVRAIIQYELHLRVFIGFQKWVGLPYAMHTIGSSMAVRAVSYCKHGGMNKKKAGEDFYFLHKIGDKGKVGNIHSTMVVPSPRISDRVPFGTGKAVGDNVENQKLLTTYNPRTFEDLKAFLQQLPALYENGWDKSLRDYGGVVYDFLNLSDADKNVRDCKNNTRDFQGFTKRFYQWFNAFKLMKYCHYCRDVAGYTDAEPLTALHQLMEFRGLEPKEYKVMDAKEALLTLRVMDKYDYL